jgi:NodT family efflux transporter outer membrane factor (OMF) lipoprotein
MNFNCKSSKGRRAQAAMVFTVLLIAGCAVGPNFQKPVAPDVSSYTAAPLATAVGTTNAAGGQAQRFVEGMDIPGEWWTLYHSRPLNDLIERSLTNNPNVKAAQAALTMARENTSAQKGAYWPGVNAGFSASRQEQSDVLSPALNYPAATDEEFEYDLFTPEVSVSYVPDVFGLNKRTVESLQAQEEQQRFALVATYITLSANVVSAAIQEASLRAQIEATRRIIVINTSMLQILRNQFARGYASQLAVAAQEAQLAQAEAALPPLLTQLDQQHDLLAVLAGDFPNGDSSEKFELSDLQLPEALPVSLPSKLVEQRPDVRQAEENLHYASAQIGIAIANRLPNITLTANAGSTALALDQVFSSGTGFWGLGAAATTPLFEGGTLLHRERAAKAAYVQAAEQYRAAVLTAFQNVADTLNALEHDGDAVSTAAASADAAKVTLDLTKQQLQTGYTNFLAALNAELAYQQAVITLVQAQANRYADTAALFQALGGGWWNRPGLTRN